MEEAKVTARINGDILEKIDSLRGEISRTKFIEELISKYFDKPIETIVRESNTNQKIEEKNLITINPDFKKITKIYLNMVIHFYGSSHEAQKESSSLIFANTIPVNNHTRDFTQNRDPNEKTIIDMVDKIKKRVYTGTILDGVTSQQRHWIANADIDNVELKQFQKYLNFLLTHDKIFETELTPENENLLKLKVINDKLINWKHGHPQISKDEMIWLGAKWNNLIGIKYHGHKPKK